MVGDLLFNAFARSELLAGRLAGCAVLGSAAPLSREESVMSQRMLYQFVDSNTGGHSEMEVGNWRLGCILVEVTRPSSWGRGISECALYKMSVGKNEVSDQPTEEESTPVFKSLVIAVESDTR